MTYSLINHQFVCWLNPVNVLVLCPYLLFYLLYPLQNIRVKSQPIIFCWSNPNKSPNMFMSLSQYRYLRRMRPKESHSLEHVVNPPFFVSKYTHTHIYIRWSLVLSFSHQKSIQDTWQRPATDQRQRTALSESNICPCVDGWFRSHAYIYKYMFIFICIYIYM